MSSHSKIKVQANRWLPAKVLELKRGVSYLLGNAKNADIRLNHINACLFEEGGKWVLMVLSEDKLMVNQESMSSVELRKNLDIELGRYKITFHPAGDPQKTDKKAVSRPPVDMSRYILWGSVAGCGLIFMFLVLLDGPSKQKQSGSSTAEVHEQVSNQQAYDDINDVAVSQPMDSQAYDYYQQAINYYDQGSLKSALLTMFQAVAHDPQSRLIQSKITDWEQKMDRELTRYFRQACFDLEFLRYYEAEHVFRVLFELSYDQQDVRYLEAKRILDRIKTNKLKNLRCGAGQ